MTAVLGPLNMPHSAYEQPLSSARDGNAARGHSRQGAAREVKWYVHPQYAAAGLWTTPPDLGRFGIELQQSLQGKSNEVLTRAMALAVATPVGIGPIAIGMSIERIGED